MICVKIANVVTYCVIESKKDIKTALFAAISSLLRARNVFGLIQVTTVMSIVYSILNLRDYTDGTVVRISSEDQIRKARHD